MEKEEGRLVVMGRAEIDTRPPFKSVKEAVMLFGERVLAGEIYAIKLKQMRDEASENKQNQSKMGALTAELEETRHNLQKAREEAESMGKSMISLRQELEETQKELKWLKARDIFMKQPALDNPEIEELKFIENSTTNDDDDDDEEELGKKRFVKFASPPSLTKLIVTKEEMLDKSSSAKKSIKKKSVGPVVLRWLFSKKKGNQQSRSP